MRIVVIDDSQTNLVVLRALCVKHSAECVSFTGPEAAIDYLLENDADAIVVDYSMPGMTGIEMIKRLRASPRHAETPTIMVTSSLELAVRRRAMEVGASAFLNKPLKPAEFQERLAALREAQSGNSRSLLAG